MIETCRVVQDQTRSHSYDVTTNAEEAAYLESVLELTKPKGVYGEWHRLIAAPFRYPLPVQPAYQARFTPPQYDRNALYCSKESVTALYEHAYHFLRQRIDSKGLVPETGLRTILSLFVEESDIEDIGNDPNIGCIMDRKDYSASHDYIRRHPEVKVIGYPSCRDPQRRMNYAVLEIASVGKTIGEEKLIEFYFEPVHKTIRWIEYNLEIDWKTAA
ncbi:MAG: RES family NAD+ phosphorylase [Elusimicrobiota bacterium]